jgi:hypothetical protein
MSEIREIKKIAKAIAERRVRRVYGEPLHKEQLIAAEQKVIEKRLWQILLEKPKGVFVVV